MNLRAGCCSFPVGHASYFANLDTIEAGSFASRLPRAETAARWRVEAPRDFVFSVVCDPIVPANDFRPGHVVEAAWEETLGGGPALRAAFVVFEPPPVFYPQADHLRYFYTFLKAADRAGALFAWQPARGWEKDLVGRICKDLGLVHVVDPLVASPVAGTVNYFRLRGAAPGRKPSRGHRYSDAELKEVLAMAGGKPTYAYFATAESWQDSRRLVGMTKVNIPYVRNRGLF